MRERITKFNPAWDKRSTDPKKDYGIHGVQCYMVLKGEEGAVHFIFSTGMLLTSTMEEYIRNGRAKYEAHDWGVYYLNQPMGYDVGYHSLTPSYDGQGCSQEKCAWLDDRRCYCDGSALRGGDWFEIFLKEGSDKIWEMLEEEYNDRFIIKK
jgi:hypothetical protein